jgi:hypothetical protein
MFGATLSEQRVEPPATEPLDDPSTLVALLADKAQSLGNQVTNLLPKMDSFMGVAAALIVGAVTLGVTQNHPVILVLFPFPLIALTAYLLQTNTEMLSRAGHKRFLEEAVNELVGRRVLLEESDVAPTLHGRLPFGRLSILLVQGLLASLLVGSVVLAILHLDAVPRFAWRAAFWLALGIGTVMLMAAVREQGAAYERAYQAARSGYRGAPIPSTALLQDEPRMDPTAAAEQAKTAG